MLLEDNEIEVTTKWYDKFGLIVSLIFHLMLILLAIHVFDKDKVVLKLNDLLPTETRGYSIEMITLPSQDNLPHDTTPPGSHTNDNGSHSDISTSHRARAEINFQAVNTKTKLRRRLKSKHEEHQHHSQENAGMPKSNTATKNKPPAHSTMDTAGIVITAPRHALTAVSSAPIVDMSKLGAGDKIDSSTDGNGNQAGAFDLRVIEYGQDAAYAINQNIIVPQSYRYVHVTYRAFVTLNRSMQFQSMQLVKSTGNATFDANIAAALRETIYPPLPAGANWEQFHNIDFTIK